MPKQNIVTIHIVIKPDDDELEFYVKENIRGQELFDLVCRAIGLRESYYFGLHYELPNQQPTWLRMDKKIRSELGSDISTSKLHLKVEFYPIDVETGLILNFTRHLFFVQVKREILLENVYCPAEEAILLASYAVQAKYGDFDKDVHKKGFLANEQLLPNRVLMQYKLTSDQWEERIVRWYSQHCQGLSSPEAESEYLKTAQNLDMYGIGYYRIQNEGNSELWLGIHSTGISIYKSDNKLIPEVAFIWSEIRHFSFKNKQITIQPMEREVESFNFISLDVRVNQKIMLLCQGNHKLYMKSRAVDSTEVIIMKQQAQKLHEQRQRERVRFEKEQLRRIEETKARLSMEERLRKYQNHINEYREQLTKAEETTDLLAQKALVAEEEARLLLKKAVDLETETKDLKLRCMEKDEEKNFLQSNIERAEIDIQQILQESDSRARETQLLKHELDHARQQEKLATDKLLQITSTQQLSYMGVEVQHPVQNQQHPVQNQQQPPNAPYLDNHTPDDIKSLHQERRKYLDKSTDLQRQLTELKSEIEGLKVSGSHDVMDLIHLENIGKGETRFSTLQKIQAASTNARVQVYQRL